MSVGDVYMSVGVRVRVRGVKVRVRVRDGSARERVTMCLKGRERKG